MRQVRILDSLQMIFQAVYEKTESVLATVEINKARRFELSSIQPLQRGFGVKVAARDLKSLGHLTVWVRVPHSPLWRIDGQNIINNKFRDFNDV